MTQGLDSLQHVRSLTLEHVKVACLPPQLESLRLVRCRLKECPLPRGWRLQSLIIDSCTGQVKTSPVLLVSESCRGQVRKDPCPPWRGPSLIVEEGGSLQAGFAVLQASLFQQLTLPVTCSPVSCCINSRRSR